MRSGHNASNGCGVSLALDRQLTSIDACHDTLTKFSGFFLFIVSDRVHKLEQLSGGFWIRRFISNQGVQLHHVSARIVVGVQNVSMRDRQ